MPSDLLWREEEQASLQRSLHSLQTQLANERVQREGAEREADLLANENATLEQRLGIMEGCQVSEEKQHTHAVVRGFTFYDVA